MSEIFFSLLVSGLSGPFSGVIASRSNFCVDYWKMQNDLIIRIKFISVIDSEKHTIRDLAIN